SAHLRHASPHRIEEAVSRFRKAATLEKIAPALIRARPELRPAELPGSEAERRYQDRTEHREGARSRHARTHPRRNQTSASSTTTGVSHQPVSCQRGASPGAGGGGPAEARACARPSTSLVSRVGASRAPPSTEAAARREGSAEARAGGSMANRVTGT